jgi:hypothetical protein
LRSSVTAWKIEEIAVIAVIARDRISGLEVPPTPFVLHRVDKETKVLACRSLSSKDLGHSRVELKSESRAALRHPKAAGIQLILIMGRF